MVSELHSKPYSPASERIAEGFTACINIKCLNEEYHYLILHHLLKILLKHKE